jgi:hypothetical protein
MRAFYTQILPSRVDLADTQHQPTTREAEKSAGLVIIITEAGGAGAESSAPSAIW